MLAVRLWWSHLVSRVKRLYDPLSQRAECKILDTRSKACTTRFESLACYILINIIQSGTGRTGSPTNSVARRTRITLFDIGSPSDPHRIPLGSP